ncbi:MAG: LamG domain-containing protein, partial [Deltaproteobacteria bacterium]|nr:LamG domain-containing protein [Deltaproteobacteria bacterium]
MKRLILISVLLALGMIMILNIPIASASLSDGLVAYYPFNGNADDESGNGNDATEHGDINYKLGIIGQSVSFDGVDDYINVKSHTSINPIDQLAISFWVKVEGFTNVWSPIVHKGGPILTDFSNREYAVFLQNTTSFLLCSAGDDSSQHYYEAYGAKLGGWTHYVGIIDRKNHLMKIYVDGILKAEGIDSYSTFNNNDNDLIFGSSEEVHSAISPFKGRLDDLRIYNRTLSEDEIKSLYNEVSHAITVPVESTFDTGLEGWTGHPSELSWWASGGNPNGFARWGDIGAGSKLLSAPGKFLGDWSALDGVGFISFDQKIFSTGNYNSRGSISMSIAGPGGAASWHGPRAPISCPGQPGCDWTTYVAPLMESEWTLVSGSWSELLANVTSFNIVPEFYGNICCGPEISGLDNVHVTSPGLIGETLKISPSHEFSLEQYTQSDFTIQLTNPGKDPQSASLEVINPHSDLTVSLTYQNPITIAPGEVQDIPIVLDAGSMPVGVYDDLLLKLTVEDGETLYSNIKVSIVEQGTGDLPDLSIRSDDIQFTDYTLGESATLKAVIHN